MGATDLILQRKVRSGFRQESFTVFESPVMLRDDRRNQLVGLAEWEGEAWVFRLLNPQSSANSGDGLSEYKLSSKPLHLSHDNEHWYLAVRRRDPELPDIPVKQEGAQPRRQIMLVSGGRVLHSELLPVNVLKCEHPILRDIPLPALLDEKWVNVEVGPNLTLKSRIVLLQDPKPAKESSEAAPVAIGVLFFASIISLFLFNSSKQEVVNEKPLAPIEVSAAKIAQIRDAMAQPDEPAAAVASGAAEPANASSAPAKPKDAKVVKLNSSLSKLLGAIGSNRVVAPSGASGGNGSSGGMLTGNVAKEATGSGLSKGQSLKAIGNGHTLNAGSIGKASVSWLEEEAIFDDGLDRDVIARIIRSHLGEIRYCYERQLSADPDLEGKVQVRFTIGAEGSVVDKKVNQSTLGNGFVEGCILQKVSTWSFPKPKGGVKVAVTYPFLFRLSSE